MRTVLFGLSLVVAMAGLSSFGTAAGKFVCGNTYCICDDTSACKDMRKSGMCSGLLECQFVDGKTHCSCVAARTVLKTRKPLTHPPAAAPKP